MLRLPYALCITALPHVVQLCELLLLEYPEKLNGKGGPLHRAIIICSTTASSKSRKRCLASVRRLVGGLGGTQFAQALLRDLQKLVETTRFQNAGGSEQNDSETYAHALVECVTAICSAKGLQSEDAQLVALAALLPAHHPAIVAISSDLWIKIVKHLSLEPLKFVAEQESSLKTLLVDRERISPVSHLFLCWTHAYK